MKYGAEIGHYISDAHVPLHASSNHNGQFTNQKGIHGFWESRVPELLAEKEFDFFIGKADYIQRPRRFYLEKCFGKCQSCRYCFNLRSVISPVGFLMTRNILSKTGMEKRYANIHLPLPLPTIKN